MIAIPWKSVIGEEKPAKHGLRGPAGAEWVKLMIAIRLDRGQSFRLVREVGSGSHLGQAPGLGDLVLLKEVSCFGEIG
jgi:hypothetical protein